MFHHRHRTGYRGLSTRRHRSTCAFLWFVRFDSALDVVFCCFIFGVIVVIKSAHISTCCALIGSKISCLATRPSATIQQIQIVSKNLSRRARSHTQKRREIINSGRNETHERRQKTSTAHPLYLKINRTELCVFVAALPDFD